MTLEAGCKKNTFQLHQIDSGEAQGGMELIAHEIDQDVMILSADGGLNSSNAAGFIADIEQLIDGGLCRLIVDCDKLEYVSSYGLGVLLGLSKRMKSRGGEIKLAGLRGLIVQVLHVSRLDGMFQIYQDVDQARLSFRS
jgi:stage II sporulation protein AA (anti-sigma F factor antagonist)